MANREEFLLGGPEAPPLTTIESSHIPSYLRIWVWVVIGGGFTMLAFYFRYYQHWGGKEASLSRFPFTLPLFRSC